MRRQKINDGDVRVRYEDGVTVTHLTVQRNNFGQNHRFEIKDKKIHNSFGYVLSGNVTFSNFDGEVKAGTGDFIFIPEGIRYVSEWSGTPEINFISLHFRTAENESSPWSNIPMQVIKGDTTLLRQLMEDLNNPTGKENDVTVDFLGYAVGYQFLYEAYRMLEKSSTKNYPPMLGRAVSYMKKHLAEDLTVTTIAEACFISPTYLHHLFLEHAEMTPITYLRYLRTQYAKELLIGTDLSLNEIAFRVGYNSAFSFRENFKKATGVLPSAYKKKH